MEKIVKSNPPKLTKKMRSELDDVSRRTFSQLHSTSSRSLIDLLSSQISFSFLSLRDAIGSIWKVERPYGRVSEEIIVFSYRVLAGFVLLAVVIFICS